MHFTPRVAPKASIRAEQLDLTLQSFPVTSHLFDDLSCTSHGELYRRAFHKAMLTAHPDFASLSVCSGDILCAILSPGHVDRNVVRGCSVPEIQHQACLVSLVGQVDIKVQDWPCPILSMPLTTH